MNGVEKLHPLNHDLYRRIQHLVSLRWKWEAIALDVGVYSVKDLCEWVLAYREPKKLPMVSSRVLPVPVRAPSLVAHGVRLAAWQKQHDGARRAREAVGK